DEDSPTVGGGVLVYADNTEGATALVRYDTASGERRTLSISGIAFGEATASLRLRVVDRTDGQPAVARVSVRQQGGKFHFPLGAMHRHTAGLGHFYCRDTAALTLPA